MGSRRHWYDIYEDIVDRTPAFVSMTFPLFVFYMLRKIDFYPPISASTSASGASASGTVTTTIPRTSHLPEDLDDEGFELKEVADSSSFSKQQQDNDINAAAAATAGGFFDTLSPLLALRLVCLAGLLFMILVFLYLRIQISKAKDERIIQVHPNEILSASNNSFMSSLVPVPPPTDDKEPKIKVTVQEYDSSKLEMLFRQFLFAIGISVALHLYFESAIPLVAQILSQPKLLLGSNIFKIHFVGRSDKTNHKLKRPWAFAAQKGFMEKYLESYQKEMNELSAMTENESENKSAAAKGLTKTQKKKGKR